MLFSEQKIVLFGEKKLLFGERKIVLLGEKKLFGEQKIVLLGEKKVIWWSLTEAYSEPDKHFRQRASQQ